MAIAGSLTYDTKLDTKGFQSGLNKIGGIAKGVAVGVGASIAAIGTGLGALLKSSVSNYAEYEQLVGGVDTLFKESSQKLQGYAAKAYKTAQIGANEYMNTVTSFSASLLQSLGGDTDKAADIANRTIIDMADNANKMGTSMEMIQNAYQGFAKQNYTMLDNLKLGYGGTKKEMERLLEDATKLSGIEYDVSNFADIAEAIHVIQKNMDISGYSADELKEKLKNMSLTQEDLSKIAENMGISYEEAMEKMKNGTLSFKDAQVLLGTSAKEASTTIEGSTNMAKASWDNLVTAIARDHVDFEGVMGEFVDSVETMFENLLPRILIAIEGIGELIPKLGEILLEHLPEIIEAGQNIINGLMQAIVSALPTLITTGTQILQSLLNGIIQYLPQIIPVIIQVIMSIVQLIIDNLPTILEAGVQILFALMEGIAEALPDLVPQIVKVIIKIMEIFNENFDKFLMLGIKIILGLIEGLIKSIPDILKNLPTIIMAIINFFTLSKFLSIGKSIITGLIKGLGQAIPNLLKNIPKIIGQIINTFKSGGWSGIGKNIIQGIINGFSSMGSFVKKAIKNVCSSMLNGIKSFFGIHSPSTLMRDQVGKYLPQGIAVGIETDTGKALDSIDKMNDEIYDRMKQAVNMETGKMAFSGTAGSVSQILSSNATFDGNFVVKAEVEEGTLFEAQQRIARQKNLQTGFGG